MRPFDSHQEPVALPGEAVRLEPLGEVRRVTAVEQMAKIGPVDYGAANSQDNATEGGSNIIDLADELEMDDFTLGQFWVNPLSNVEVEIRQEGQQEQRFVNSNQVGQITMNTPANQRLVFVWEDMAPYAIINNPTQWDFAKTLVYYTGFKMHVSQQTLSEGEVKSLGGTPASVPIDSLKKSVSGQ